MNNLEMKFDKNVVCRYHLRISTTSSTKAAQFGCHLC